MRLPQASLPPVTAHVVDAGPGNQTDPHVEPESLDGEETTPESTPLWPGGSDTTRGELSATPGSGSAARCKPANAKEKMKLNLRSRGWPIAAAETVIFAAAGGVAYATIPNSSGVINGCYGKLIGVLRVIDARGRQDLHEPREPDLLESERAQGE